MPPPARTATRLTPARIRLKSPFRFSLTSLTLPKDLFCPLFLTFPSAVAMKGTSLIQHPRAASGSTQDSIIDQKPPIYNCSKDRRFMIPVWPPRESSRPNRQFFKEIVPVIHLMRHDDPDLPHIDNHDRR